MDDIISIKEKKELIIIDEIKIVQDEEFLDESINTTLSAPESRDLIADLHELDELATNSLIGSFDLTNFEGEIEIFEDFERKSCEICSLQFSTVSNFYRHLKSKSHQLLETAYFAKDFQMEVPYLSSMQNRNKTIQDNPIHINIYNNPAILIDNDPVDNQQAFPIQFEIKDEPDSQYSIVVENIKHEDAEMANLGTVPIVDQSSFEIFYKCTFCFKNFSSSSNLQRHMNLHVPKEIYNCAHCPKTFKQREYWKKHSEIHKRKY